MECINQVLTRGRALQNGFTPLLVAVQRGNLKVAKLLLKAGADINAEEDLVSEGLGIRTRGGFEESLQPWGDPRRPARNGQLLSGADQ